MPYLEKSDQRAAAQRHYKRNSLVMKQRAATHRENARKRNREYVAKIKEAAACGDCGVNYPSYVMQFDHLGQDKDRDVATLVAAPVSLERIDAEIAKCEVVCANCHAIRTYTRRRAGRGQDLS